MFANCAFFHPANVTFMRDDYTNTPFHHLPVLPPSINNPLPLPMPIVPSILHGVNLDSRVSSLENRVQQLSTRLADVSAELAAAKKEASSKGTCKEGAPETLLGGQDDSPEKNKEKPATSKTRWWPFKFSEQQTGVTTENEINSGTDSEAGLNEGPLLQIFPLKDTSTQTAEESSTIMDINKLKTKVDNLEEIVRHQSDNYNLKTRVGNLEKLVRHQSDSADTNLKTLESRIKQDLMQEMGRLKTDITDKVDEIITSNAILNTNFTNLQQNMEGLAGNVENKIQTMDGVGTEFNSLIERSSTWRPTT